VKDKKSLKTETIQEYLARGGAINKLPMKQEEKKKEPQLKQNAQGPAVLMTYDEADLYYGEGKKKKAKTQASVDLSALPDVLKKKHLAGLMDEENEQEDQEAGEDE
jgi:hypothetical protein